MILEGIVTTLCEDGTPNVAPMGPIVDAAMRTLLLRPFQTSTTFQNLKRRGEGVLHVTDDVDLFVRAAIGRLEPLPACRPAEQVAGAILLDTCRWYEFRVVSLDDALPRTEIQAEVVEAGRGRDWFGFNRAKHAVLEAAILATRIGILSASQIREEMARLESPVEKTGEQERRAFGILKEFLQASGIPLP